MDKPNVTTMTPARRLWEHVNMLWTRYKMTTEQVERILRKFSRYGIDVIIRAVDDYYESDPDARGPHWNTVGEILRGTLVTAKHWTRREDGSDYIRAWWRSDRKLEPWHSELLAADEEGHVTGDVLRDWSFAELDMSRFAFREWPRERFDRMGEFQFTNAHKLVKSLQPRGKHTERQRHDWLELLETIARANEIELSFELTEMDDPF